MPKIFGGGRDDFDFDADRKRREDEAREKSLSEQAAANRSGGQALERQRVQSVLGQLSFPALQLGLFKRGRS